MNVRKFVASTARDALRKVKELLGPDAIILSNRAIPGGVEIMAVAASDMEMILNFLVIAQSMASMMLLVVPFPLSESTFPIFRLLSAAMP